MLTPLYIWFIVVISHAIGRSHVPKYKQVTEIRVVERYNTDVHHIVKDTVIDQNEARYRYSGMPPEIQIHRAQLEMINDMAGDLAPYVELTKWEDYSRNMEINLRAKLTVVIPNK